MQFLNWHGLMNQRKTVRTTRVVSFLLHIHVLCSFLQYFPPFVGHFAFLNISKCSMMPRWHHSDSSSERYQEVKSIKTFYAAHISRSQAKSMFGNWTNKEGEKYDAGNYRPVSLTCICCKTLEHIIVSNIYKGTSRQRSGKGATRKRFPLQKPRWEKTKPTIRYLYHETYSKPNEQLFSQ